jgi:hypothetical protein
MTRPLDDDALITLKQACEIGSEGGLTVATLKAEWRRSNLEISKIGRTLFTTRAKLKAMEEKCRVDPPDLDYGSIKRANAGRSATAKLNAAQIAVASRLSEPKKNSRHI